MGLTRVEGDVHFSGNVTAPNLTVPTSSVGNNEVEATAGIARTKVVHQFPLYHNVAAATTIAADTVDLHIARAAGTLVAFEAAITGTIATGADRTVTVDLHKSTAEGAFATVLSATIGFTNASVLRRVVAGTINTTDYVDGDIFRVVITVAGAAGNQALGLVVTLTTSENPE